MQKHLEVCVLAAGMGKRMKSDKPKALQPIGGRPMLEHLLESIDALGASRVHVVIGKGAEHVQAAFKSRAINWIFQTEQKGTGHAVQQAIPEVDPDARLLMLLGDAPLITSQTLARLVDEDCDLAVLSVDQPDPYNYGRIIRDTTGQVLRIVEERDATIEERAIHEINTGVMSARSARLLAGWLDQLNSDNDQGEFLLTDIVAIASNEKNIVHAVKAPDPVEVAGVNSFEQLARLEREFQRRIASRLMADGVHLVDPARLDVRGRLVTGRNVHIDANCVFEGDCELGDNVRIGPNCFITDSRIGANTQIRANSVIENAETDSDCTIGPFARLRPGTRLGKDVGIGNFVEVKNTTVGDGSKASHLSYLGDAELGSGVNIGAGTITCNYDGVDKHRTRISDHVFVGSNTALVAPVTIGEGSTIGAGSTITRDVEPRHLAVARGRQKTIANWKGRRDS